MKVVLWTPMFRPELVASISAVPGVECAAVEALDDLRQQLAGAQVLVTAGQRYSGELAALLRDHAPELRTLQLLTAGYELLEVHGVPPGIDVCNAGDSWSPAVAEHAITLMLALMRGLPCAMDAQRRHDWAQRTLGPHLRSPHGRTLVIVGYGSIGREAARLARAFGMRVVGVSRSGKTDEMLDEAVPASRLQEALSRADVMLVCVPSGPRSRGLIGAAELAACPRGALLVNIARGDVVDRQALLEALHAGHLGGAGLDVTDPEPLGPEDPMWDAPNLIVTPHMAGFTGPGSARPLCDTVSANLRRLAAGDAPLHRVTVTAPGR